MTAKDYLRILHEDIHSTVFATVDERGLPNTCVVDIMLHDDDSVYFLTARGKAFYERLAQNKFAAVSGMKGRDTLSTIVVSVRGKVREIGTGLLPVIFAKNPYMAAIYPKEESRKALTVFQLYEGEGEYFDLSQLPPVRDSFRIGKGEVKPIGYSITDDCIGCGECQKICPTNCIRAGEPFQIIRENCIHCGNCANTCPAEAVIKL